jgi:hypothetical protein
MNSKTKISIGCIITISIVTVAYLSIYYASPRPIITETMRNPHFNNGCVTCSNVTVTIENMGAAGWVKVTANYQVDEKGNAHSNSTEIYMEADSTVILQLTYRTGTYIDGSYVWLPFFSQANVEPIYFKK